MHNKPLEHYKDTRSKNRKANSVTLRFTKSSYGSVKEIMKKITLISGLILLVSCAVSGPKYSTSIYFDSYPGPILQFVPVYPEAALSQQQQGSVTMSFVVGEHGKATDIQVIESAGEPLDSAATQAVQEALHDPKFRGKSVTVVTKFTLNN